MADVLGAAPPDFPAPVNYYDLPDDPATSDRDSLLYGARFGDGAPGEPLVITYSFASAASVWPDIYPYPYTDATGLTADQQQATRSALATWEKIANIDFIEVEDRADSVGTIRFGRSDEILATGIGFYPYPDGQAGDVWLSTNVAQSSDRLQPGSMDYFVLLHEIGHALGLEHTHDEFTPTSYGEDWTGGSVMAYRVFQGQAIDDHFIADIFPSAPMALDIEAIRYLYGTNPVATGNDTYRFAVGERLFETLVDDGGVDTLDWSNQSSNAVIDLRQGNWSELGTPYSWPATYYDAGSTFAGTLRTVNGTIIERAIGGRGDDRIIGNGEDNILQGIDGLDDLRGGQGNDLLIGGTGADRLYGEGGDDRLLGEDGQDVLDGGAGIDDLNGGSSADLLDGGASTDRLFGADGDDRMGGGAGNDFVYGGNGQDLLVGGYGDDEVGGGAGDDKIAGGPGNNRLSGGTGRDQFIIESAPGAVDRITDFIPTIDKIVLRDGFTVGDFVNAQKITDGSTMFDLGNGQDVLVVGVVGANAVWFG